MSQIDFFLTESERIEFIKYCFKHDCNIIPDRYYKADKYVMATNRSEYESYCKYCPLLFITSKKFTIYPLEFDSFESEDNQKYFIMQRQGGPTIDFYSPVVGELEDNIVGPGYLGIYPFYYAGDKRYVPNKSLIELYKFLTAYIKKCSRKVSLTQRTFWIGTRAIEKAKKGEIQLLPISNIDLLTLV